MLRIVMPRIVMPRILMPRILIIEARFYSEIADLLAQGAEQVLADKGVEWRKLAVPGVFETPAALAMAVAAEQDYDGYIVLGCVIRGETSHYDYVCGESAAGLNRLAIQHQLALGYGVLTVETMAQAMERACPQKRNKGGEAARACLQMIELQKRLLERDFSR
ncbi:MAG: 6,7-dimethyl-8-ribityllumazine synthase [Pseudomonadota bacterium]